MSTKFFSKLKYKLDIAKDKQKVSNEDLLAQLKELGQKILTICELLKHRESDKIQDIIEKINIAKSLPLNTLQTLVIQKTKEIEGNHDSPELS